MLRGLCSVPSMAWTSDWIHLCFNLWLQEALLMISGCLPFMKMCWLQTKGTTVNASQFWFSGVYALVYIVSFIGMCWHYKLPFQRSFNVCVDDLLRMARLLGTTYNTINIIIFVVLFLALIAANIVLTIKI